MHRLNFACLLTLVLATCAAPVAARADDPIGQIKTLSGSVTVTRGGASIKAAIGDHVMQSDEIATGSDGAVGITFADNSMMSLGPSSKLDLDQFQFDTTTHAGIFNSSLKAGTLAVKSGQIVQQTPFAMHVQTPAALLGVRGTEFVVRADGGGN
jgi:hypothetical protein